MDFKCYYEDCRRSYQSRQNLRRHINTDHLKIKTYPCSICGRMLSSKRNLINHSKKHLKLVLVDCKKKRDGDRVERFDDIKPLLLSEFFKENREVFGCERFSMNLFDLLPPVDSDRQIKGNFKIKLAPGLLNYIFSYNNILEK